MMSNDFLVRSGSAALEYERSHVGKNSPKSFREEASKAPVKAGESNSDLFYYVYVKGLVH